MNTYKIFVSAAFILLLTISLSSCGGPDISGVYIPKEKHQIKSIEFKDGNARFTDSILGIKQGRMEFKVSGNMIDIRHPFSGSMIFNIIDSDTLKCDIPGMSGFYIRQK
jgi:hypothetical protein